MLKKVEKDIADNSVNHMKPCKLNDQDCVRLQTTSEVSKICILPVWEIKLKKECNSRGCYGYWIPKGSLLPVSVGDVIDHKLLLGGGKDEQMLLV